jgi:hypothetical protein
VNKLRAHLLVAALAVVGSACNAHKDNVCQDIGDCARGGDTDWIKSCQSEAAVLEAEAAGNGCGAAFDSYYSCADSNYACHGATALFPGCDEAREALDTCLAAATASSECVRLANKELACAAPADAGADGGPPPACTAVRDCEAHCYLENVTDVCAPRVDELQQVTICATTCPP